MQVLVSGSHGLVGTALSEALAGAGHRVVRLTRTGVTGGDDPFNRATYPWADRGGQPDTALLAEFRRLTALRHQQVVLRRGSLEAPIHLDEHVIVWLRRLEGEVAIVAVNNADAAREIDITMPPELGKRLFEDARGGERAEAVDGRLRLRLPAIGGRVLLSR